jgi:hypothetical protein
LLDNNDTCSNILFKKKNSKYWYTGPWNE